jgi:hypothetical protein
MEIGFEFVVGENLLGGVFDSAHVDDIENPHGGGGGGGADEGSDRFEDDGPHVEEVVLGALLFIDVGIHEVGVEEVEEFGLHLGGAVAEDGWFSVSLFGGAGMVCFDLFEH